MLLYKKKRRKRLPQNNIMHYRRSHHIMAQKLLQCTTVFCSKTELCPFLALGGCRPFNKQKHVPRLMGFKCSWKGIQIINILYCVWNEIYFTFQCRSSASVLTQEQCPPPMHCNVLGRLTDRWAGWFSCIMEAGRQPPLSTSRYMGGWWISVPAAGLLERESGSEIFHRSSTFLYNLY